MRYCGFSSIGVGLILASDLDADATFPGYALAAARFEDDYIGQDAGTC
jgi:hypothetical protein